MHAPARGWTKLHFNLCLVKLDLGKAGVIEVGPATRGIWILTGKGRTITEADLAGLPRDPNTFRNAANRTQQSRVEEAVEAEPQWKTKLLDLLTALDPAVFERLAQQLLRKAGFLRVEVTGKGGDGGIDGVGTLRIAELLAFDVYFQCKRFRGAVSSGIVRDFRGALAGRSDKGLLITTGTFTADAPREANRDGVPPIDLVDGERLCDLLKSLKLGVRTEMVEQVVIDDDFWSNIGE